MKYCVENLANNTPKKDVEDMVKKRKEDQIKKMKEKSGIDYGVEKNDYNEVLKKFAKKPTKT